MRNTSFACIEGLETRTLMSAGDIDPSYGNGGSAIVSFNQGTSANPRILLRRGDGSIAVVGDLFSGTPQAVIANFTPGGFLDSQFANNPLPLQGNMPEAAAVQPDGKIVVVTTIQNASRDLFVYRLNTDGTIDPTFNATGQEMIDVASGTDDMPVGVAIQHNGGIVIAGILTPPGNPSPSVQKLFLVRLNPNGPRDFGFGQGGLVTMTMQTFNNPLTIDAADNIIVQAATMNAMQVQNVAIVRLDAEGQPDAGFNNGLPYITNDPNSEFPQSLAILPSGSILSASSVNGSDEQFLMLHSDGTRNAGYGNNGVFAFPSSTSQVTSLGVDSSGRVLVAYGLGAAPVVQRLLPDAMTPDGSFGVNGIASVPGGSAASMGVLTVVPADNSIYYLSSTGSDFTVTHLLGDAGVTSPPPNNPPTENPPPNDGGLQPPPNNQVIDPGSNTPTGNPGTQPTGPDTSTPNIIANYPGPMSPLLIGGTAQVGVFVSYSGPTSTSVDADVYLSTDSVGGNGDDILIGHLDAVQVAPNTQGMDVGAATVQIPANLPAGNYYLVETVDPSNLVAESNENDNTSVRPMALPVVQPGAVGKNGKEDDSGFNVENAHVSPMNVPAGGTFTFSANLTNNTGRGASRDSIGSIFRRGRCLAPMIFCSRPSPSRHRTMGRRFRSASRQRFRSKRCRRLTFSAEFRSI